MSGFPFTLSSQCLEALPSGALHWPAQHLLCVSDLHLGKSARLARRGGALLPPYETRATLSRLDADLEATGAQTVICLGDSFDDLAAAEMLDDTDQLWLLRLMAGRNWIWVEGNHDPGPIGLGGSHRAEVQVETLTFRHVADPAARGEISGHYHPKARLAGQARPCFLLDEARLILPAYGAYTGGLWAEAPILTGLMRPEALAILTGRNPLRIPMPRGGINRRPGYLKG
ncbi:MAG TPA: ligase-associated DNA damage response endonuclease PdeM [Paracoccaceae bacterium]